MISLELAEKIINDIVYPVSETEVVELNNSVGRIIAEDIISDVDMPPFDKSAMDGYACRMEDISLPLEVLEIIAAGAEPSKTIGKGQCSKIMTGAKVPAGADCVIMVENTKMVTDTSVLFVGEKTQKNICRKGEDINRGDLILAKGSRIGPQTLAILAATGCTTVKVFRQVQVGFFCTGSELVEPDVVPVGVSIRNSNASQLWAQIVTAGALPCYGGILADTQNEISEKIEEMLERYRIVIVTGGASVGDFDFIPEILNNSGFTVHFQKVGIQPGKPVLFATRNNNYIFGLSGNPVSSFLQFDLLVKPLIFKLYNCSCDVKNVAMIAGEDFTRKKSDRKLFIPVKINDKGQVVLKEFHGSAHITALQDIYGFAVLHEGVHEIEKGSVIHVRPI